MCLFFAFPLLLYPREYPSSDYYHRYLLLGLVGGKPPVFRSMGLGLTAYFYRHWRLT